MCAVKPCDDHFVVICYIIALHDCEACIAACVQILGEHLALAWAARYNTWLLIKLTLKGVVFSFLFLFHLALDMPGPVPEVNTGKENQSPAQVSGLAHH